MKSAALSSLFVILYMQTTRAFLPSRVPGFRFPLAFSLSSMAEKVLVNPQWPASWPYTEEDFKRMDESDDAIFYDQPRLVYHIDDVRAVTIMYEANVTSVGRKMPLFVVADSTHTLPTPRPL